ncbi:hypothetical protein GWI34_19405 [Actinomadura sp. DSM 109109]|nr:hypothetical protein [Actinomadura lepetitiana]
MTTRARAGGGVEVETSMDGSRRGGALVRAVLFLALCSGAGAAGRIFGGDWVWAGFAAALMLTNLILLRGAWRSRQGGSGIINAQAAQGNAHMDNSRSYTLNAGGFSAGLGALLVFAVNTALVAHVSTDVPGGRYYRPEGADAVRTSPPATAVEPVFLRDLPDEQMRVANGNDVPRGGARLAGRQCARSVYLTVSSVGLSRVIVLTPSTRFQKFTALAGVPDDQDPKASVEFALLGDAQQVIDQKTAAPGSPAVIDRDVSAYATLYLRVTLLKTRNGSRYAGDYQAVWGDAQLLAPNGQARVCPTSA